MFFVFFPGRAVCKPARQPANKQASKHRSKPCKLVSKEHPASKSMEIWGAGLPNVQNRNRLKGGLRAVIQGLGFRVSSSGFGV